MNKLAQIIKNIELKDLKKLKKDLKAGNIEREINRQLELKTKLLTVVCPVCGMDVKKNEGFYIEFGHKDMRKKAYFDGIDCLQYFIDTLKAKQKKQYKIVE